MKNREIPEVRRIVMMFLLTAAIGLILAGCRGGPTGPETITVTDDVGREVTIPQPVARIVSLAPANTEILFAVGAGDQVVGVDAYSNYPPEAEDVEKVGDYLQTSAEAVIALNPDVALASTVNQKLVTQLEQLGISVLVIEPDTFEDLYDDIMLIGRITGNEEQAAPVVEEMKVTLAGVTGKLAGVPSEQRPLVWYEVCSDPLMSAGPNTYIHQVIELAGGINLARDADSDYPIISNEYIVAQDPEVIVWPVFPGAVELTAAKLSERPGWVGISAVREDRISSIDADIISRAGPRLAEAVELMARLLHPELFR